MKKKKNAQCQQITFSTLTQLPCCGMAEGAQADEYESDKTRPRLGPPIPALRIVVIGLGSSCASMTFGPHSSTTRTARHRRKDIASDAVP